MRIALAHPTYWPEVKRGSERLIHDLSAALVRRGHEVTILTSHPGRPQVSRESGVRVIRAWRPPSLSPFRHYEHYVQNAPNVLTLLTAGSYDVVQAFFPVDAWAAALARRLGGPPLVMTFHGTPTRRYLVSRRYRLEMISAAAAGATEVTVLSTYAADLVRRYLRLSPVVLPGGVDAQAFQAGVPRDSEPTILCPADLSDPRKRGELLLEAFRRIRTTRPTARLLIAVGGMQQVEARCEPGVTVVRCDDTSALAQLYARAWTTVLPSIEEAFGLVLLESLVAGRPVVAARSGGCPEIVTNDQAGVLFEPDDGIALASAIGQALELAGAAGTVKACRRLAADFEWSRIVERYEQVYSRAAGSAV